MRGGETGGVKQKAQDAIAAIRNAKELLGEGPRFRDVDSVAFNAGDTRQQSIIVAAPRSPALRSIFISLALVCALLAVSQAPSKSEQGHGFHPASHTCSAVSTPWTTVQHFSGSRPVHAGLRRTSDRLAAADKGIKLLTRDLEHGGLQRRLNGPEAAKSGRQRSPYSPWLAQPYLKASHLCVPKQGIQYGRSL